MGMYDGIRKPFGGTPTSPPMVNPNQNPNVDPHGKAGVGVQGIVNATHAVTNKMGQASSAIPFYRNGGGATQQQANPYGYASGPGILQQWFNQRASGTDPGYQYAMNRGMNDIDSRMAAGGSYNSGARGQQLSDYAANMGAQREAQLDALAGGASGEYMGQLGMMFGQGQALANAQAGTGTAYDLGAAGNMAAANTAQQNMALNSAAQQQQAHQGFANNALAVYGLSQQQNGGGNPYYNANNPYPV